MASRNVHPAEDRKSSEKSSYTVKAVWKFPSRSVAGTVMTFNLSTFQIYNNMATQTNQKQLIDPSKGEIILYQTADGRTSIDVKLENETVWLSSEQMALLFERDRTVIQRHIRNIYNESELTRDTTCAKFAHMGRDGDQTYVTELFNLDVIISVGYRVKSQRGTQFRIWANSVLKEYLIQGYAVRNGLVQQRYNDLKALVDVMGRTMGYLDSPAGRKMCRKAAVQVILQSTLNQRVVFARKC